MCLPDERRALRLEERRDEEGMAVELHGADLAGPIPGDDPERPLLEETRIPGAESVAAVVGLLRAVGAVDPGEPGAWNDEHLARDLHQLGCGRRARGEPAAGADAERPGHRAGGGRIAPEMLQLPEERLHRVVAPGLDVPPDRGPGADVPGQLAEGERGLDRERRRREFFDRDL